MALSSVCGYSSTGKLVINGQTRIVGKLNAGQFVVVPLDRERVVGGRLRIEAMYQGNQGNQGNAAPSKADLIRLTSVRISPSEQVCY